MAIDGPAVPLLAGENLGCLPAPLGIAGVSPLEDHWNRLAITRRIDLSLNCCDDHVAIAAPSKATAGQPGDRQHFQPEATEGTRWDQRLNRVAVLGRTGPFSQPGAVLTATKARPAGTGQLQWLKRLPGLLRLLQRRPCLCRPGFDEDWQVFQFCRDGRLGVGDQLLKFGQLGLLVFVGESQEGVRVAATTVGLPHDRATLRHVVEQRKEGVELSLRKWVVLVVVTAGTANRQP